MSAIRFFKDKKGQPQAEPSAGDANQHLLCRFLETDVGGNLVYCSRILAEVAKITAAKKGTWSVSGNGYGLTVAVKETEISPLFPAKGIHAVKIATPDFAAAVQNWHALINPPKKA
jgi:hypothetical protein